MMDVAQAAFEDKLHLLQWAIRYSRRLIIVSYDYLYFQPHDYLVGHAKHLFHHEKLPLSRYVDTLSRHSESLRKAVLDECSPVDALFFQYDDQAITLRQDELKGIGSSHAFPERLRNTMTFIEDATKKLTARGVTVMTPPRMKRQPFGFKRLLLTDSLCFEQTFPKNNFGLLQPISVKAGDDIEVVRIREDLLDYGRRPAHDGTSDV